MPRQRKVKRIRPTQHLEVAVHFKAVETVFKGKGPGTCAWVDGRLYEKGSRGRVERVNPVFEKASQYSKILAALEGKELGTRVWFRERVYKRLSDSVILVLQPERAENDWHKLNVKVAFEYKKPSTVLEVGGVKYRLDKDGRPFKVLE